MYIDFVEQWTLLQSPRATPRTDKGWMGCSSRGLSEVFAVEVEEHDASHHSASDLHRGHVPVLHFQPDEQLRLMWCCPSPTAVRSGRPSMSPWMPRRTAGSASGAPFPGTWHHPRRWRACRGIGAPAGAEDAVTSGAGGAHRVAPPTALEQTYARMVSVLVPATLGFTPLLCSWRGGGGAAPVPLPCMCGLHKQPMHDNLLDATTREALARSTTKWREAVKGRGRGPTRDRGGHRDDPHRDWAYHLLPLCGTPTCTTPSGTSQASAVHEATTDSAVLTAFLLRDRRYTDPRTFWDTAAGGLRGGTPADTLCVLSSSSQAASASMPRCGCPYASILPALSRRTSSVLCHGAASVGWRCRRGRAGQRWGTPGRIKFDRDDVPQPRQAVARRSAASASPSIAAGSSRQRSKQRRARWSR